FHGHRILRDAGVVLNESDTYREWAPPEAWRGRGLSARSIHLRNRAVPGEDVIGPRPARRLRDERAVDVWIRSIEPDRRTAAAIELLQTDTVEQVATRVGISTRQLQRNIVTTVGLTPKTLQRVMRMRRFLDYAERRR